MIRFTDVNRDQYVPSDQYVPDIKIEEDKEGYFHANKYGPFGDMPRYNNDFKMPPISTFCAPSTGSEFYNTRNVMRGNYVASSDGECSPKSVDENEISDNMMNPVSCVRGVRTITRNPGRITRHRGGGSGKSRGRGRKSESIIPKEKDRARLFNEAFDGLRKRIPSIPVSKKLSKIEILRLAISYMAYLKFLLECDFPQRNNNLTLSNTQSCPTSPVSDDVINDQNTQIPKQRIDNMEVTEETPTTSS